MARAFLMFMSFLLLGVTAMAQAQNRYTAPASAPRWGVWELALTSAVEYVDPIRDVRVEVVFTNPVGAQKRVEAFWDGGRTWRARFSPDRAGPWRFDTVAAKTANTGLHGVGGAFGCVANTSDQPLLRHGALRLSDDRRFIAHADGTPFFWFADTAWNGPLLSDDASWQTYLTDRVGRGFTAVQFVTTQWRAAMGDREGRAAYTGREKIALNPAFFQRMDGKVAAINAHGMVAVPVMLWAVGNERDPGSTLPEDQAILLARYINARYGAYQVVWFLGGDGDFRGPRADRWRRIGRSVFDGPRDRLVTMHPGGGMWIGEEFRGEPWYDFVGYQSGHGDNETTIRWLVQGPAVAEWRKEPARPLINLEPIYEGLQTYHSRQISRDDIVRKGIYWSLLVTPTAGVTYGHNGLWSWTETPEEPLAHPGFGVPDPWHVAIQSPGADSMRVVRALFDSLPWWRLRPAQELLVEQPGEKEAMRFIAVGASEARDLAVLYLPDGGTVRLHADRFALEMRATWFDPRAGERHSAGTVANKGQASLQAPTDGDWVLLLVP